MGEDRAFTVEGFRVLGLGFRVVIGFRVIGFRETTFWA